MRRHNMRTPAKQVTLHEWHCTEKPSQYNSPGLLHEGGSPDTGDPFTAGLALRALTGPLLHITRTDEAAALPITSGSVVRPAQPVLRPPPTPTRPAIHFPVGPVIGRHAPAAKSAGCRAGEGLPSSRRHPRYVPRPIRRGVPHGCTPGSAPLPWPSPRIREARHSLRPPSRAGPLTTPQASRHATDRIVAPPYRAFDAGLRPGPFPDRAASLLPGLLAATRTGLPSAGDDELTNTKKHHGTTSRCHLLLCWAHETSRLGTDSVE